MAMRKLLQVIRSSHGASAVEFALIAPVLVAMLLSLADAVNFAVAFTSMQRGERAGIQYFMNGGTSTDAAQGIVSTAWKSPPSNYTVTAQKVCKCGNAMATCLLPICANGNGYTVNMQISASATVRGLLSSIPESKTEIVRIQ